MSEVLYIVIPAYNEEENIENIVNDWYPVVVQRGNSASRLVIIDDGSKDNTRAILEKCRQSRPLLEVHTKVNGGHGAAVLYGYKYALSQGADYIFQTDSDGQTIPSEFEKFWELRDDYDLVIGHRSSREDGLARVLVTRILRYVIRLSFKVDVVDANIPFRLMEAACLKENIRYVPDDFNLSNVVLSVVYYKKNQRIKYLPITFRQRQGGKNSINLRKITEIGIRAFRDFREINKVIERLS